MIKPDFIKKIVLGKIEGTDLFLVDIKVSTSNKIDVYIDGINGIQIKQCVAINREIEGVLDREQEDFELQVSSPGIDTPFVVMEQYHKNIGRHLKIQLNDNTELEGKLLSVGEDEIQLEEAKKVKIEGKKKKQLIIENKNISLNNIHSAKVVISFK